MAVTREYICKKCGEDKTEQVLVTSPPRTKCECGGKLVQVYGKPEWYIFEDPRRGAKSKRFL